MGREVKLCEVEAVKFRVVPQTCCVELMREFAPVRLETLLALLVEEIAGGEVVALAVLLVALALEIILANGALIGLAELGRPTALVPVLGASLRGLVRLVRHLNEV